MIPEHSVTEHVTLVQTYPAHEPRATDVHYSVFTATRRRLERLGALTCWIGNADCDTTHPMELHHAMVEFSLANIVDVRHFRELYPEFHIESDEAFLRWVEGEGNLLCLCRSHHRGHIGIHSITYPAFVVQRYMLAGTTPPEHRT